MHWHNVRQSVPGNRLTNDAVLQYSYLTHYKAVLADHPFHQRFIDPRKITITMLYPKDNKFGKGRYARTRCTHTRKETRADTVMQATPFLQVSAGTQCAHFWTRVVSKRPNRNQAVQLHDPGSPPLFITFSTRSMLSRIHATARTIFADFFFPPFDFKTTWSVDEYFMILRQVIRFYIACLKQCCVTCCVCASWWTSRFFWFDVNWKKTAQKSTLQMKHVSAPGINILHHTTS